MPRMRSVMVVILLGAAGCAGGEGADPVTGSWFYSEGASISDSCAVPGFSVSASTEFYLTNNGDGSFTVVRDGQDIECSVDEDAFDCLPVPLDPVTNDNVDAVFQLEVSYSGTFEDDMTMLGQREVAVSCEGADCDTFAALLSTSFPCALNDGFSAMLES